MVRVSPESASTEFACVAGSIQRFVGPADEEMNLGSIGRAIWRNKRSIIGPTLIMAAAAFIGVNLITPRYKSEARVLVEGRENIFLRPEADKAMTDRGTIDAETVTSQVQLILSRDLAREVIKDLNLTESPEFNAALKEFSPLSALRDHRDPQGPDVDDARGAGARRLLRPADGVRDRQVAGRSPSNSSRPIRSSPPAPPT